MVTGALFLFFLVPCVEAELCYNGGIFDGIKCICDENLYYGPKCEFPLDEIPVIQLSVTVTVDAQVRVTNKEYNKSLEDLNSNYYREIQTQFKKQMKDVYGAVPGYKDVEILRMKNGSIIVEHKVISQVLTENNLELIQRIIKIIIEAVEHSLKDLHTEGKCIDPSGPELCFVPLPNSALIPSFSLNDTCKNVSDTKYADYYYPYIRNGTVRCITRCSSGTPDSMNCFNGVCRLSEIGPHCICNNLDVFWYLDSYCRLPIQKTVLGLSLALAVFFVLSIILVICLIKAKRKNSRNRRSDGANCDKIGQRNPIFQE
ncbi:PREDICTED: mucin-3B-like [Thamnophis sirtalis]|uniref:Mucin-3B-like n=1 Tax=Thamnophis sirtalis TaxID=35019 RepID=A0A6I9XQE6_9SAUR|nr:PREDICTED: mucin-3B-like [Thamnophis sirtalis]